MLILRRPRFRAKIPERCVEPHHAPLWHELTLTLTLGGPSSHLDSNPNPKPNPNPNLNPKPDPSPAPHQVELHHRWHEKTAEATHLYSDMLVLLSERQPVTTTCRSDDECQSGLSCLCGGSKDVSRRRRALLFAATPKSSCTCQ